jgi:hypothetical protein
LAMTATDAGIRQAFDADVVAFGDPFEEVIT